MAENERLRIDPSAVEKMVEISQYDIRQVINML